YSSATILERLPTTIEMNLHFLERRHPFFNFVIDQRKKSLEFGPNVHDLYNDRQVLRQPLNFEGVQTTVRAKTHHASHDGGARQPFLAGFRNDPLMQKPAVMAIAFANKDAQ